MIDPMIMSILSKITKVETIKNLIYIEDIIKSKVNGIKLPKIIAVSTFSQDPTGNIYDLTKNLPTISSECPPS